MHTDGRDPIVTSPTGAWMRRRTLAPRAFALLVVITLVACSTSPTAAPSLLGTPAITSVLAPTASPEPTPSPTPMLIPSPLDGLLVTPAVAARHPIAVMIDDHDGARPQAGFNAASVVWQAPAEGGIPRYMMIFSDQIPTAVGPIRSAREYFIDWAAEWDALYVHAGGNTNATLTLRAKGDGTLVWNADALVVGRPWFWRVSFRVAPHNLYTDGAFLRNLAAARGAVDAPFAGNWAFGPDADPANRPVGGAITVVYPYESITYRYDHDSNNSVRYLNGSSRPQVDAGDKQVVAPKNVVILRMAFSLRPHDSTPGALDAADVGSGQAFIATNGVTIRGTWRKSSVNGPTLLFDAGGNPVTLTAGQTFVQVISLSYGFTIKDGVVPAAEASPSAS